MLKTSKKKLQLLFAEKANYIDVIENIAIVLLIFLFTFPKIEPDFAIGLDASYVWALNFLFHNDYNSITQLIYPIGPLGFLKLPSTEGINLEISLAFYSILKIWFIYSFLSLAKQSSKKEKLFHASIFLSLARWYSQNKIKPRPYKSILKLILSYSFHILLIGIISYFSPLDFIIIGLAAIYGLKYIQSSKLWLIIPIAILSIIGLCIKSSIGVSAFAILTMTFAINTFQKKDIKLALKFAGIASVSILSVGLIVFQSFSSLFLFIINTLKLTLSYSDALSLHPANNWFLLGGFVLSIIALPIILIKEKNTKIVFLLLFPALFAVWKHGIGRQDITHYTLLVYFVILFWGLILAFSDKKKFQILVLATISIALLYGNMTNIPVYKGIRIEINGINNFSESVLHFKQFKSKYKHISLKNVSNNTLDNNVLEIIGNSTIDVFPWELSFIAANNLNYKARQTLQGGSYSSWLDQKGADDFKLDNGADFLIFHYVKDKWEGDFGSIDGRFLLNDNPKTIINILNNYSIVYKHKKFLLLEKQETNNLGESTLSKTDKTTWNTWIDVPNANKEILRIKISSDNNLKGKLRSFFYKSEEYYVDYYTVDDKILTYRYIPDNAIDGIWLYPFIQYPANNTCESDIEKIRFRCSYPQLQKDEIEYQFESTPVLSHVQDKNNTIDASQILLGKTRENKDSVIFYFNKDFTSKNQALSSLINVISVSEQKLPILKSKEYSFTYICKLETLWTEIDSSVQSLNIEAIAKYINMKSAASIVISIEDSNNDFWGAQKMQQTKAPETSYTFANTKIQRDTHSSGILKVYIWNHGESDIEIKEFSLKLITNTN